MTSVISKQNIPKEWEVRDFTDCVMIPTKIIGSKRSEYKKNGPFPIFDQAQSYISGYTDREDLLQTQTPAIIFGDHTRVIKYIDRPYTLGADGTKVFWAKKGIDSSFLYQSLLQLEIPNTGYNRHYKWLKEARILVPPMTEQKRIAEILGTVDEDIAKTQKLIDTTEKLKRGLMQQLFTRGIRNAEFKVSKLGDLCIFQTGKLNSNKAVDSGAYPFFTCSQETFAIDQYSFDQKAILLAGNNAAGKYSVKYYDGKFDAYQRTYVISIKNEEHLSYPYLKEVLNTRLNELRDSSVGSTTKFLTLKLLENLPISLPPISEQREIAEVLSTINEKISINKKLKGKLTFLKKGLMQDLLSAKKRTT